VGRGRRGIKAGRLTGNTKHVCILQKRSLYSASCSA
jgi:hypothetical protein